MQVYLDNAASTPLERKVFEEMEPYLIEHFGNPSSVHAHGRVARTAIERSRKKIADILNVSPSEILFTSSGTEADNAIIKSCVETHGIQHIISTKIEHRAVLNSIKWTVEKFGVKVNYLSLDKQGVFDFDELENFLKRGKKTLVSLMHGNNEIGNLLNINRVGELCKDFGALFHSDTVQTMGHYLLNLSNLNVDYAVGSAHKIHGPKGVGFQYVKIPIAPMIIGGGQERNMRAGTENVAGIVGMAKAMELSYQNLDAHRIHVEKLKGKMILLLKERFEGVSFNGLSSDMEKSLYTVLNVSLPNAQDDDMIIFNLDINGVSASSGSACSSGVNARSYVVNECHNDGSILRFSFSRYNTPEEIDYAIDQLCSFYPKSE